MNVLVLLEDYDPQESGWRVFKDHKDFLAHDDGWLIYQFRNPRVELLDLCVELGPVLNRPSCWNYAMVHTQVLTALGF